MNDIFTIDTGNYIERVDYQSPRLSYSFSLQHGQGFDDSVLRLVSFSGQSAVSQPFEYQLVLHGNEVRQQDAVADDTRFSFHELIGKSATVRLDATNGPCFYNGLITSMSMAETGVYNASIKPALWKLSLSNAYRIYSGSIKDVIRKVLARHGIGETADSIYRCNLDGVAGLAEARHQDWLQAGESDLEFITRLMGKVSIYYYFEHGATSHTLVLANCSGPGGYRVVRAASGEPLKLYYTFSKEDTVERDDIISNFSYKQDMTVSSLHTVIAEKEAA